jgi:enoyl reductase-like protein
LQKATDLPDTLPKHIFSAKDWSEPSDWSKQFVVEPMPFDGFLFGSHVMVTKEAHTSPPVRDLIVAAAGVDDSKWESTYVKDTVGIITVAAFARA